MRIDPISLWQRFDRRVPERLNQDQLNQELKWCEQARVLVRLEMEKTRPLKRERLARTVSKTTTYASMPVLPFSMTTASLIWTVGHISNRIQDALKSRRQYRRDDLLICDSLIIARTEAIRALLD